MEYSVAGPEFGVHTFDIVTILRPNGEIGVTSCLLWADCEGPTSHYTTSGYSIDIHSGKIAEVIKHYSYCFVNPSEKTKEKLGREIDGIKTAIQQAKDCHR